MEPYVYNTLCQCKRSSNGKEQTQTVFLLEPRGPPRHPLRSERTTREHVSNSRARPALHSFVGQSASGVVHDEAGCGWPHWLHA